MPEFAHAEVAIEHPLISAALPLAPAAVEHTPFMPVIVEGLTPLPAPADHLIQIGQMLIGLKASLDVVRVMVTTEITRQTAQAVVAGKVPTLDDVHELLNRIQAGK